MRWLWHCQGKKMTQSRKEPMLLHLRQTAKLMEHCQLIRKA
jgi:hypothetical protein